MVFLCNWSFKNIFFADFFYLLESLSINVLALATRVLGCYCNFFSEIDEITVLLNGRESGFVANFGERQFKEKPCKYCVPIESNMIAN